MPDGSKLLAVRGELHVVGAEAAPTNQLSAYGFSGEVIPIVDPDGGIDINTLWDNMVTKPIQMSETAGVSTVDFDFDTTDPTPDTEPGEVDTNDMFGLLDPTKEIFAPHLEWMSFAKGAPIATTAGTPDTYTPRDYKTFNSTRRLMADGPSYAMLAVSSPSLDNSDTTELTETPASAWGIMENVEMAMDQMLLMQTGIVEAGAESPYVDITTIIGDWLAPDMINPSSSLLDPMQHTVFCIADWIIDVPNSGIPNVLDANNG